MNQSFGQGLGRHFVPVATWAIAAAGIAALPAGCCRAPGHSSKMPGGRTPPTTSARRPSGMRLILRVAARRFMYRGRPINPRLLDLFIGFMSDAMSSAVRRVDLTEGHRDANEYGGRTWRKRRSAGYRLPKGRGAAAAARRGWFMYRFIGRTQDGVDVVDAAQNGGGSGIFGYLLFLRFTPGKGAWRGHLMMNLLAIRALGDRYNGKIVITPRGVVLGASQGPPEAYPDRLIPWPPRRQ